MNIDGKEKYVPVAEHLPRYQQYGPTQRFQMNHWICADSQT